MEFLPKRNFGEAEIDELTSLLALIGNYHTVPVKSDVGFVLNSSGLSQFLLTI